MCRKRKTDVPEIAVGQGIAQDGEIVTLKWLEWYVKNFETPRVPKSFPAADKIIRLIHSTTVSKLVENLVVGLNEPGIIHSTG